MDFITALCRFAIYTLIFALLLDVENVQKTPLLWGYLAVIAVTRLAEVFSPASHTLRNYRKDEDHSRWTSWVIGISFFINLIAPMLEYRYKFEPNLPPTQWWNWLGLLLFAAGSALRIWAMQQDGAASVPHVKVDNKLKLVTNGPYALVRHPSYLGLLITYLGVAVLFGSVIGAAALLAVVLPTIILRLAKEEQLLSAKLGEAWQKYQKQTACRLLPNVW